MISRGELLKLSQVKSLRPDIIEKDYVLGWILAGIARHPLIQGQWAFKGGTCLKKCFFETYRFSEDLDFTVMESGHLNKAFLEQVFTAICNWVYEQSGVKISIAQNSFEIFTNSRNGLSCQGRLAYQGPISPRSSPRVKLDLTADERVVMMPEFVAVHHDYSDSPEEGIYILSYTYEELFGEKVRALIERTRPRDLYDVVTLFRNDNNLPDPKILSDIIKKKCEFKNISFPELKHLEHRKEDLKGSWQDMLGHQLPMLPDLEHFYNDLPNFFAWLAGELQPEPLQTFPSISNSNTIDMRLDRIPVSISTRTALEIICFAAANWLCVELTYWQKGEVLAKEIIEPYSLHLSHSTDLLLMAVRHNDIELLSYGINRIANASCTNTPFKPRYYNELSKKAIRTALSGSH